jgi:hypothetical protein
METRRITVEWQNTTNPLPERMIRGAELLLDVEFPQDYRECVRINHGGHPEPGDFRVQGITSSWVGTVGVLLSLDPRRPENVWATITALALEHGLPDHLIPIADDGGGDLVCLDYRSKANRRPSVVYWSHEVGGEEGIVALADNFSVLLELIVRGVN